MQNCIGDLVPSEAEAIVCKFVEIFFEYFFYKFCIFGKNYLSS